MPVFQPVVQYYRNVKHVGTVIINLYTGTLVKYNYSLGYRLFPLPLFHCLQYVREGSVMQHRPSFFLLLAASYARKCTVAHAGHPD